MFVVKVDMKRLPQTCKDCCLSEVVENNPPIRICGPTHRVCPTERSPKGNVRYTKPKTCPLMEIELIERPTEE